MSASRVVRNKTATRFTDRVLLAIVTGLVLTAAACSGEAGVEGTAAHGSGALDEPAQPAERPATPSPMALGALAYPLDGDIYLADWDGSNRVRIADGRSSDDCNEYWSEGPMWSPDGRYLAYRHTNCQDAAGWGDVVISDREGDVVTSFPGEGWLISWSPDSTRVAVWVRWGETIGVYGLDGARQGLLTLPPGLMAGGDFDPVWSRDGASLLVPHGVEVPLDGSTPRQLPPDDPRSSEASYSPDGSRVAYVEASPPTPFPDWGALMVASADGSGARVFVCCRLWDLVWSPTEDRIAFVQQTSESDRGDKAATELRVIDVTSGTVTRLAGMGGTDVLMNPQFSPEGDRILFAWGGRSYEETSLWTVDPDGSDLRRLVIGTGWGDWQAVRAVG
jgi:Tol biopolymer transport system component